MTLPRALVLGGAGFVGSHLCDRLLREGHHVIALDDFSTGSRGNLAHLKSHPRFRLEKADVTLPLRMAGRVDWIFNLASPASPVHYQSDPIKTTLTNVLGTLHALELAVELRACMLQASTSEVYGDPEVHPQPESYWGHVNPVGLRSCYDEGKRCAESLAMDFVRAYRADVKLARIFNTYGPRMAVDDGRVVSNFIVQALRGEDITIYGDGSQTRSFCYVDDLLEQFLRFMRQPRESGPLNLGNSGEFSVLELARTVVELTGTRSRIVHAALPKDDPKQRKPDLTRTRAVLGFEARVDLQEGLRRTIDSFRRGALLSGDMGLRVVNTRTGAGPMTRQSAGVRATGGRD